MIVTESDRLLLRQFRREDHAPLMDIFGDAEVMRYGDGVRSAVWVTRWLLEEERRYRTTGYGRWAVVRKGSAVLGYCGLTPISDVCGPSEVAVDYRLARRYWEQGYASEAVAATIAYGFGVLGFGRLVATIDPGNAASIRVAEKSGMVYEKDVMYRGYTHPDRVYVIEK